MSSFSHKGSLTMKKNSYEAFVNKQYRINQFLESNYQWKLTYYKERHNTCLNSGVPTVLIQHLLLKVGNFQVTSSKHCLFIKEKTKIKSPIIT